MERINSIVEDDVKFQKIKNLPKRCHFYSIHRQLSWQCKLDVDKFERDAKMVTLELSRNQTIFRDRLAQLNTTRRQLVTEQVQRTQTSAGFPTYRRKSCPNFNIGDLAAAVAAVTTVDDKSEDNDNSSDVPLRREHTVDVGSLASNDQTQKRCLLRSNTIDESVETQRRLNLDAAVRRFTLPHVQFRKSKDIVGDNCEIPCED